MCLESGGHLVVTGGRRLRLTGEGQTDRQTETHRQTIKEEEEEEEEISKVETKK